MPCADNFASWIALAVDAIAHSRRRHSERQRRSWTKTVELAGDEVTEAQVAETLTGVIGRSVRLVAPQMSEGAAPSPERLAMFAFFNGDGYDADIAALRRLYPPLMTLEQWLRATGWENAEPLPIPPNAGRWG